MPDLPVWADEWCQAFLGARPVAFLFCVSHLSEVVGVRLADGREVVVKRRVDESGRAGRCVTAQRLLTEQGFPCSMPLTDVIVSDGVAVHAVRFVGGGELETKDTPEAAARSGRLLADLVRRLAALDLDPPLPNPEWVRWTRCPSATRPQPCPPGSRTPPGACRQSWPDATCHPYSVTPTGKRRTCAGGTERHTPSTTGTASPGCPKRRSPEARLGSSRATAAQHSRRSKAPKPSSTPTKSNAAPASRPTRRRSPGRRASGKLSATLAT